MAEIKPGCGLQREYLYRKVPLKAPYTVNIVTSTVCNFRCNYCVHSLEAEKKRELGLKFELMGYDVFSRIVDSMGELPELPKSVFLYGVGEPLCNPDLEKMVAELKRRYPAVTVSFISNGALLTEERTRGLVDAGLDILRVSIQGLSDASYREVCGADVTFDGMVEKLSYFYQNRKQCKLYVKVIDTALKGGEEEKFYRTFDAISDRMYIEKCMPIFEGVDYSDEIKGRVVRDRYGNDHAPRIVCPMTFFTLSVMPDGEVRPCDNLKSACHLGNIRESGLREIWTGSTLREFWSMQLNNQRFGNEVCRECVAPDDVSHKEDELDAYRLELLNRITGGVD